MLIGYMRISKSDGTQSFDLQKDALFKEGISEDRIYSDMCSGKNDQRQGLQECLKALQPGNTLVVWKLDRLGRNLKDLISIVQSLTKREIGLRILTGSGAQLDTSTAQGRMLFGIFGALAEYERELIAERTRAGLAASRARGRKGGRPFKLNKSSLQYAASLMSSKSTNPRKLAENLGISVASLYNYINSDGSFKDRAIKLLEKR